MATRPRDTFKKRQKELLRVEKQRDKVAKRLARKSAKELGGVTTDDPETAEPENTTENETTTENKTTTGNDSQSGQ